MGDATTADVAELRARAQSAEKEASAAGEKDPAVWRRVDGLFGAAVAADPEHAETLHRAGLLKERLKDWGGAAELYERSLRSRPDHEDTYYRLGFTRHQLKQKPLSKAAYAKALALDPTNPPFLAEMLAMESRDFVHRQRTARFIVDHLDAIRADAAASRKRVLPMLDRPVFVYWAQGAASAPPIVRTCIARARRVLGDRLHVIDDQTWPYYTELPPELVALEKRNPTHFSDILRMSLLSRYGGTWMDATCFLRPDAADTIDALLEQDFFAFRYVGPRISSWFLTARPASYIASMMEAILLRWWRDRRRVAGYFMYHDMFETLSWADPRFGELWDTGSARSAHPPHALQRAMFDVGDAERLHELVQGEFVHKLTYKYPADKIIPHNLLAALIRSGGAIG